MNRLSQTSWKPPTLETARLILRPFAASDVDAVYDYAKSAAVAEFVSWHRHASKDAAQFFLDEIVAPQYEQELPNWAICLKDAKEHVLGSLSFIWAPKDQRVLELGYVLHQDHWGKGLMAEACKIALPIVWELTAAERIFAPIHSENAKSRRLAEKVGLKLDGILRSHIEKNGQRWDMAIYSQIRSEASKRR